MSTKTLRTQLREEYLTCPICFNSFTKPKALPCLHTYCEGCLRDYVVSRGFESAGCFPCPTCRNNTSMPEAGVEGFPSNYLMSSLSDTIENSAPNKPVPKPRRSVGQPQLQQESEEQLPPSYLTVADTSPRNAGLAKVCSNDSENDWMVVARQEPSAPTPLPPSDDKEEKLPLPDSSLSQGPADTFKQNGQTMTDQPVMVPQPPPYYPPSGAGNTGSAAYPHLTGYSAAPIGWNFDSFGNDSQGNGLLDNTNRGQAESKTFRTQDPRGIHSVSQGQSQSSQMLYPTVPAHSDNSSTACSENLALRFGKQGSSVRDFLKPIGLAVSKEGNYIVSDSGADQNRIFIFNSAGDLTAAFNCGCKVKDVAVTKGNEILAAVHKSASAIRIFTMAGQCKGEYGKFFTFEEPCGIVQLTNGGVAVTGTQNHCVYVLTDQMKLATKFGRKGNGDGYFQHPGYVAVDSKNHIIVTDKINGSVQVFNSDGKFKLRFGSPGKNHSQLQAPLGVCVDDADNIIVADSGNFRVEVFSSKGRWVSSVVTNTQELGDQVKPVNVAYTPTGKVAVLLRGPYFAEVRIYSSRHKHFTSKEGPVSLTSIVWYSK